MVWFREDFTQWFSAEIRKREKYFFEEGLKNMIVNKDASDRLKWAWVRVDGARKMCWVDNKTMIAYEADGYERTRIEIPDFTFERWCTTFDL